MPLKNDEDNSISGRASIHNQERVSHLTVVNNKKPLRVKSAYEPSHSARSRRSNYFSPPNTASPAHNLRAPLALEETQPLTGDLSLFNSPLNRPLALQTKAHPQEQSSTGSIQPKHREAPNKSYTDTLRIQKHSPSTDPNTERISLINEIMSDDAENRWNSSDQGVCNTRVKVWSVISAVVVVLSIFIACIVSSVHKVNEGNVGIYFKQGALLDEVTYPGVHWMAPFVTEMREVSIRPKTDTLRTISSITKDGIQNRFNEVQVISDVKVESLVSLIRQYGLEFKEALVFDRIREELRIFCANHTIDEVYNTMFLDIVKAVQSKTEASIARLGNNGIKILNLVVPKPDIPPDIAANYRQVKVQWTEQLVATQQQKTEAIKKETESLKAVADAERQKAVLEIEIEKQILQKEGDRDLSILENDIVKKREESNADVANYKKRKEAEANSALYTEQYVQLEMAKSLSQNTKFFFSGEQSVLGGLLKNLLGGKND